MKRRNKRECRISSSIKRVRKESRKSSLNLSKIFVKNTKKAKKKILTNSYKYKTRKNSRNEKINIKKVSIVAIIAIIAILIGIFRKSEKKTIISNPEILTMMGYEQVEDSDFKTQSDYVNFGAFFLRDLNNDGYAEKIAGTSKEIGQKDTLYFNIAVNTEGVLKNGKITIDGKNFNLATAIVKDSVIKNNYISTNTTEIELNDVNVGTTKLLMGIISNKTISSQADYSQINTVTLTGTYVGYGGAEIEINKTIDLMVDWHGNVATTIETSSASLYAEDIINADSNTVDVEFTITTKETKNQLILTKSYVEVTIPELNGYKPVDVKVIGNKLETSYSEETGIFAITRNGINLPKTNAYKLQVKYPLEAYESMTEDVVSIQIPVTVTANYTGLNNNSGEFENPKTSENANRNVTIIIESIKPEIGGDDGNLNENGNLSAITIGKTIKTPIQQYVVSKEIPMKIYAGQDITENTEYTVMWKNTSNNGLDKLELSETKPDEFYNEIDGSYISGEEHISYKGIYFVNALQVLGENGTITVKNADTNEIIHKFTAEDFGKYTSSNPYKYDKIIKNIKIETSAVIDRATLYVYNIKEIDDENLTTTYTKNKLEELTKIYSYLDSTMTSGENVETQSISANANYKSSNSYATIEIDGATLSTQDIEENKILTITTISDGYGTAKWINGEFIVKFPKEILEVEINNIISNNALVEILGYEVNETEEGLYLRIITENSIETTYEIYIDANIIADSRIATVGRKIELYYSNENCSNYINETINLSGQNIKLNTEDIYDVNLNLDITEKVGYNQTLIDLVTPGSLTTAQIASEYDNTGDITIAPQTVEIEPEVIVDNEKQTAVITVQVMNNYTGTVSETTILGKIPFEGNLDKVGNPLKSSYTTHITSEGIQVPENLVGKVEVYYSENENPTKDVSDNNNGWVKNPTDLSKIKTFLIDFEEYVLEVEEEAEFTYEIEIPDNLNYNEISYSIHTVDFYLDTESGKLAQTIEPRKLGFRIAKKYDLELSKYRKGTTTLVPGMTFSVTTLNDDNELVSQIRTTDENGILIMENLYVEKKYTLKEIKVQSGYELNTEEIKFIAHVDDSGVLSIEILSGEFLETPNIEIPEEGKPIIKVSLDNEVKYHLSISKLGENDNGLNAAKFILEGNSQKRTLITNSKGNISLKNLLIGEEYTLTETNADGYYVIQESMSFKIIRNTSGKLELITSNNLTGTIQENEEELNPTLNLTIRNEKIPTYSLKITKVEEQTNLDIETGTTSKEDKLIEGVQFELYSKDLETTEILTTDANGMLTISGLYEYVSGKYITGEYTLKEIYAPAGYAVNEIVLKFRAERKNGNLVLTILEGQDLIADSNEAKFGVAYDSLNTEITTKEISIEKASTSNAIVNLRIENAPVFSLTKIDKETKLPLEGAKFAFYKVEYDENNNEVLSQVIDSEGNIFGTIETIEGVNTNVAVTNEYGSITGNLAEGYYKAVEIEAPEGYLINELEKTTYFGIGSSKPAEITTEEVYNKTDFETSVLATYTDITGTSDGGYVSAIYFSGTLLIDGEKTLDGNNITLTANGNYTDEALIKYNKDGKIEWAKRYGINLTEQNIAVIENSNNEIVTLGLLGNAGMYSIVLRCVNEDTGDIIWETSSVQLGQNCWPKQLIQTSDNGYLVVGEYSSLSIPEEASNGLEMINQTSIGTKDGIIIKYDSNSLVEWYQTIGGADGETLFKDIVELESEEIIAVGKCSTSGSYEKDGENVSFDEGALKIRLDFQGNILELESVTNSRKNYSYEKIILDQNGYTIVAWLGYQSTIEIEGVSTNLKAGLNLLNYNSDDEIEWFCQSDLGYYVSITDIKLLDDGSYILIGSNTLRDFHYDVMLMKVDSTGNIQWKKSHRRI